MNYLRAVNMAWPAPMGTAEGRDFWYRNGFHDGQRAPKNAPPKKRSVPIPPKKKSHKK